MRLEKQAFVVLAGRVGPTSSSPEIREIALAVDLLPCTLGRAPTTTQGSKNKHLLVDEGDTTLSREHVQIDWSVLKQCFQLSCLSKNGIIVDSVRIRKGETVDLQSQSAIRMGSARLYVSLPVEQDTKKRKTPSKADQSGQHRSTSSSGIFYGATGGADFAGTAGGASNDSWSLGAGSVSLPSDAGNDNDGWLSPKKVQKTESGHSFGAADKHAAAGAGAGTGTGGSGGAGAGESDSRYYAMISRAFSSGELPVSQDGGVSQASINAWIATHLDVEVTEKVKRGIYSQLTHKFRRVSAGQEEAAAAAGRKAPLMWAMK